MNPVWTVVVRRDASNSPVAVVFEHELPLLQHLYGAENVEMSTPTGQGTVDVADEWARLARKYGEEAVLTVYGQAHSGRLEKAIKQGEGLSPPEDPHMPKSPTKGK